MARNTPGRASYLGWTNLPCLSSSSLTLCFPGNGLGAAGRRDVRDLPVLWATPSSDGFMMTCPSVLGAGREGATSPIMPRRFGYEYN